MDKLKSEDPNFGIKEKFHMQPYTPGIMAVGGGGGGRGGRGGRGNSTEL